MTLKQTGDTTTVITTFDVVHDPDNDTRYDIETPTYMWHKPIRVEVRWTLEPGTEAPWHLTYVKVFARLRDYETRKLTKNRHIFQLAYAALGTRYDNMQFLPPWLAEDLAVCTPTMPGL